MTRTITADLVEAYSLCPRKAFLLMIGESNPGPHEYVRMTDEQAAASRLARRARLEAAGELEPCRGATDLGTGPKVAADVELAADGLHAGCDFLRKVNESSRLGKFGYEPVKVIGTCRAATTDILGLAYESFVLGEVQRRLPAAGTLVLLDDRPSKVKLAAKYREVR